MATGVYAGSVALADGVSVYGGYSAAFDVRDVTAFETAILGGEPTAELPGAVLDNTYPASGAAGAKGKGAVSYGPDGPDGLAGIYQTTSFSSF